MTFVEEKGRAEVRRQDRIARAQDKHLAAHKALRAKHAAEPQVGNYYVQYSRQTEERKRLDDALGDDVRRADADFHNEVARIGQKHGITTNSPHNPR